MVFRLPIYNVPKAIGDSGRRVRSCHIARAVGHPQEVVDVVVIGAGIGGLSCAALLAQYGLDVKIVESHYRAGGAAHTFKIGDYHMESGPSLYSGLHSRGKAASPLAHVLQAIDEPLDVVTYDTWNVILPEGKFLTKVGAEQFCDVLRVIRGPAAVEEWQHLQEHMKPFSAAATALPPVAIRSDMGALVTAVWRYLPSLITLGPSALQLTGPFSKMIQGVVHDPFIKNWLDLLCFLLSGLPSEGTIAAEMAFMLNEFYREECALDFPKGGSQALVDALVRGLVKRGGSLQLNSHVERILLDDNNRKAIGVELKGGRVIKARKAVVSNAFIHNTLQMLPPDAVHQSWRFNTDAMPLNRSFMHLHIGFDGTNLDDLQLHHIIVDSWENGVDAQQNVVLISIPSH